MIALTDRLLTLTQASHALPGRPAASTIWRWYKRGVRGVRLETIVVGGIRYTSHEALQRFVERTTAAADGQPAPTRTSRQREAAIRKAEAELAAAGI